MLPVQELDREEVLLSDRAVDGAVRRLEDGGLLAVQRRDGGNPKTGINFYCATLPEGANGLRRSEWPAANLTTARSEPHDVRGEGRSPESASKRVESPDANADAPDGASSAPKRAVPDDVSFGCNDKRPLPLLVEEPPRGAFCSEACWREVMGDVERDEEAARWAN